MEPLETVKLHEFTKEEWWDVARVLTPEMTQEEFDAMWEEFQETKRRRKLN